MFFNSQNELIRGRNNQQQKVHHLNIGFLVFATVLNSRFNSNTKIAKITLQRKQPCIQ